MRRLSLGLVLLAGCIDLKAPAAERRFYALDVARPGPAKDGAGAAVLKVRRFQVSRTFEGAEFVYRTSDAGYESDFYHAFFTPPASQATEIARRWVSTSGLFGHVVEAASVAPETHVLEGHVAALYADLRGGKAIAVIELQLTLLAASGEIRLHRTHKREVEAASTSPDALIAAWGRGLAGILAEAEIELAKAVR
jgi:cholesterol transport system auxiliary component